MNRTEAISIITAELASLDDQRVMAVADIVQDISAPGAEELAAPGSGSLYLTEAELAAIERSKQDFKAGRTSSHEHYRAEMGAFIDGLKAKHP